MDERALNGGEKMGTRAIVKFEGKVTPNVIIATHWDGYPEGLGKDLKESISQYKKRAQKAAKRLKISDRSTKEMWEEEYIKKAVLHTCVDHFIDEQSNSISDFNKKYDDYAEYEYVVNYKGKIKYREREGSWLHPIKKGAWKLLK